jgi:hypothetical protein
MKILNKLAECKQWIIRIVRRSTLQFMDVNYHTGFYRFSEYIDKPSFKVNGIPCLQQYGMKDFIFFTETDITDNKGVVPVEKYYT